MKQKTGTMPLNSPYESDMRKMNKTLLRMLNKPPQPKTKGKQEKSGTSKSVIIEKQ